MYDFKNIETKWQSYWEKNETFKVSEDEKFSKDKRCYVLDMFPYPSGNGLHVGHPEGYTATDIYCRYLRMNGFNVLHPMGFDAFGLPAENFAIKTGTHPAVTTKQNIDNFRRQIKALGFSYDWSREISTCDEDYYKWTQWIFLQLFKKGLAYEAETPINWCPSCLTGLANEEVKEGKCERCGTVVERRNIRQWILKITRYAERLLQDLDGLDWPESVKQMQRNWIGKSEGARVKFLPVYNDENGNPTDKTFEEPLVVFTTRPDTLFGATYMVISPEHKMLGELTSDGQRADVEEYVRQALQKSDLERTELSKEKTGKWTGSYAKNPVNGQIIPIWVSDYVLAGYGTGAIMAVPAHDDRDWDFAKKFNLPIIKVVASGSEVKAAGGIDKLSDENLIAKECTVADGITINSQQFSGMDTETTKKEIIRWLEEEQIGERCVNYKLRDWIFARQRYWGEPMPLVHCPKCGIVPLNDEDLPLRLPQVDSYKPTGSGESPLAKIHSWINCTCPKCGGDAARETNTMPQWAGSCWYYLRYLDPKNTEAFAEKDKIDYWMPVDLYIGGAEHAVLHLLYARFWHKVLFDLGLVNTNEPFTRLVNQGMITSFAYQRSNKTLVPTDCVEEKSGEFFEKATGEKLTQIVAKMSKSLKNVINPDAVISDYGADSVRMYEMFMGPLEVSKPWNTQGLIGIHRFLERVWNLGERELVDVEPDEKLNRLLHKTIKKVTEDTRTLNFNTAISQMMIFVNEIYSIKAIPRKLWSDFVKLISPYAPHMGEELWQRLGNTDTIAFVPWPTFNEQLCNDDTRMIVVQVNGKLRSKLELPANTDEDTLKKAAMDDGTVKKWIGDKPVRKVIVVPNKLVNIVV